MARYQPVQDLPARGQGIEGGDLIGAHETAIAFDVSRKDSGQASLRFNGLGQGKPRCLWFPLDTLILRCRPGQSHWIARIEYGSPF